MATKDDTDESKKVLRLWLTLTWDEQTAVLRTNELISLLSANSQKSCFL